VGAVVRKNLRHLGFMMTAKGRQSAPEYLKKPSFVAWLKRKVALESPADIGMTWSWL
jgi:hypothetical protein